MARKGLPAAPYRELAEVYDRIYEWKNYPEEARRIRAIVRGASLRRARTLLDVACGTGAHARALSRWFGTTGIDASAEMLAVARRRVPEASFRRGRMQTFRLAKRFDVVTCLFSAIGYVGSSRELRATVRNFARHLNEDGVLVLEPWLSPKAWVPHGIGLQVRRTPEGPIVRMERSSTRRGRSLLEMHYLVGTRGQVRHWFELHDLGLFSSAEMTSAFRSAGLTVRYLSRGLTPGRGLYVGRKVRSRDPRLRRRP